MDECRAKWMWMRREKRRSLRREMGTQERLGKEREFQLDGPARKWIYYFHLRRVKASWQHLVNNTKTVGS
jgi:hypothetical protein